MNRVYMQRMEALGTTIELQLVVPSSGDAERVFPILWDAVRVFESRFSRFIPDSELSVFNVHAGEQVKISDEFEQLLRMTRDVAALTGGFFNPFTLPQLQRQGYTHSLTDRAAHGPDVSTRRVALLHELELGPGWARIPPDAALDFGGIGKGYLADHLGDIVAHDATVTGCCFSLGGDIHLRGHTAEERAWEIGIQSAQDPEADTATWSTVRDRAGIATSGLVRERNGVRQAHQVLPVGYAPDHAPTLATVASSTTTLADVLASSILSGGEQFASRMLEEGHIDAALLQYADRPSVLLGTGITPGPGE